jgi:hydroxyacylglutathione hydrolase
MLFQRIESKGLAHYSYIIGDRNYALVIDPRRDCQEYIEKAGSMRISNILETHRNEDYLIGSLELANRTSAEIWHADSQWNYRYGKAVAEGQTWKVGRLKIEAIHTPGHTPGMMNYLLYDPTGIPWVLFTGDTLFSGDVGRVDLLGEEKAPEMAGLLYDSIFGKLLPLGDEVIVCPAHGAGSVCAESIAERTWTTIGIERKNNPRLQAKSREEFVADLIKIHPELPPYFKRMEVQNLNGAPILGRLPTPIPLRPKDFHSRAKEGFILDTRMELGFGGGHVPGAQSIWLDGLPSFAGWFLPYDIPIMLVNEGCDTQDVMRYLVRLGYDDIGGFLAGDMLAWHMAGLESSKIKTVTVQEMADVMVRSQPWILDVRSLEELEKDGMVPGAHHIHVTQVQTRKEEVPKGRTIYIFCGSGMRSMIAASYLQRQGYSDISVILGGMSGWRSAGLPVERKR